MKKVWRQISLPKVTFSRIAKVLRALFVGTFLGFIGVFFHNSFSPLGLVIALFESGLGFYYFAKFYPGKFIHFAAFFAWMAIVYRAATFGVSNEILVEGNINGFIFLLGGMFFNLLGLIFAKRFK